MARNRHAPDEVGKTWTPVSQADGTRRILGVLGGCDAHALKVANPDRSDHRTFGEWRRWMPLPPRTDRVHSSSLNRPEWFPLGEGVRPPTPSSAEPGEWQHSWQFHASSSLEYHHRETVIIGPVMCRGPSSSEVSLRPGSPAKFCTALPRLQSSKWSHNCRGPSFSSGSSCLLTPQMPASNVVPLWTCWETACPRSGRLSVHLVQNGLWGECAARPEQQ